MYSSGGLLIDAEWGRSELWEESMAVCTFIQKFFVDFFLLGIRDAHK